MQDEFLRQVSFQLGESHRKVDSVWAGLNEEDIWLRPNEHTLAPANQLLHLAGNLRQWVGTALLDMRAVRKRDIEFSLRGGIDKASLKDTFETRFALTSVALNDPGDLLRPLTVQGHHTTALGVWIHITEHLSYHTGQLVFFAKQLHGKAFDFYSDWALG